MPLKHAIAQVINGRDLSFAEAEAAMDAIMDGAASPAQIGSYLTALRMKGETADEIAGSAHSMRRHVVAVAVDAAGEPLIDTCGTGGDGKHTFNISTTAAFVVAGAGRRVAKHGNRAASSRSGSADLLLALGGNLDLSAPQGIRNRAILETLYACGRARARLDRLSLVIAMAPAKAGGRCNPEWRKPLWIASLRSQ